SWKLHARCHAATPARQHPRYSRKSAVREDRCNRCPATAILLDRSVPITHLMRDHLVGKETRIHTHSGHSMAWAVTLLFDWDRAEAKSLHSRPSARRQQIMRSEVTPCVRCCISF